MAKGIDEMIRNPVFKLICAFGIAVLFLSPYLSSVFAQEKVIVIKAGKVQTITNGVIENGVILIKGTRIIDIGSQIDIPPNTEVFDFHDKFIMPGVVSPDSNIGIKLSEEDSLAEAQGSGAKNLANYPVIYSIYPENPDYRLALINGFTTLGISPPSKGISGLSAVIKPTGQKLEDMLIRPRAFLKIKVSVNTPFLDLLKKELEEAQKNLDFQKKKKQEEKEKAKKMEAKEKVIIKKEKEEKTISEATKIFMDVLEGKLPVLAECGAPSAISHIIELISGYPEIKLIIRGSPDTYKAGVLLKEKNIPIIIEPKIDSKISYLSPYPERTNYVLKCQEMGLTIAFQVSGSLEDQIHLYDFLNKLYQLGIKKDLLLKGVTIIPAELLGVEKLVGSLEKGKRANLVVFKEDPIENVPVIEKVILEGKFVQW
ncbi:MAG: amidohydrolase family protein [Candidatus Aminicenantes bacterium]|nr:MAG: amidohydrolase family protein [Candidatus Aminicenantes bacterium]